MSPLVSGLLVLLALLALLGIGTPIAFALGFVSIAALIIVDAGRVSPKAWRSAGQQAGKSEASGRM